MTDYLDLSQHPHRRFNALSGDWVLVSPHRTDRPWRGREDRPVATALSPYDPGCYLCPGNARAGGELNPQYQGTFVFDNDFPTLRVDTPVSAQRDHRLLQAKSVQGCCRVICYSPRHDLTLAEMELDAIAGVVDLWRQQANDLGVRFQWVQVFENKGEMMGASASHPHGQVWAVDGLPEQAQREDRQQRAYLQETGTLLLVDYAALEAQRGERVVVEERDWLAVVPYWAYWPFEVLLLPRSHVSRLADLTGEQRDGLARILQRLLIRYDNLFQTSFPYSMGWHMAPAGAGDHWQLHAHFNPPLLRSAVVRKFMVGYEMFAEAARDITAEKAAARLRDLPEIHFKAGSLL